MRVRKCDHITQVLPYTEYLSPPGSLSEFVSSHISTSTEMALHTSKNFFLLKLLSVICDPLTPTFSMCQGLSYALGEHLPMAQLYLVSGTVCRTIINKMYYDSYYSYYYSLYEVKK